MLRKSNWNLKLSKKLLTAEFSENPEQMHSFIVELARAKTDRICSIVESNRGKIRHELSLIPSLVVELPYHSLPELSYCYHVRKVWHDARVFSLLNVAVPSVGGSKIQEMGYSGQGVTVAVIDTGIYPHRDLVFAKNRIVGWHDLVNQRQYPYDDNGHGTHIAGIIAGDGLTSHGKYKGMAPEANLVGVKVLDEEGGGSISTVIAGIEWCLQNKAELNIRIINLSLGSTTQESYRVDPLCRAATAAWQKGVVVCAAAGNEGPDTRTIDSPGNSPLIITVGNLDDRETVAVGDDQLNPSSSRGPTFDRIVKPDLLAPGTEITSLWINGGYRSLTGTSMASPMVAGAAAQIIQKWPQATPAQIKQALLKNAKNLGLSPYLQGAGVLSLENIFAPTPSAAPKRLQVVTEAAPQRPQVMAKLQASGAPNLLFCHLMKVLLEKRGISTHILKEKRDELLQRSLVSFFFE